MYPPQPNSNPCSISTEPSTALDLMVVFRPLVLWPLVLFLKDRTDGRGDSSELL